MKRIIASCLIMMVFAWLVGFAMGIEYQQGKAMPHLDDIDYLMQCHEVARDTHQYFVDNPGHYYGQDAFTQEQWVEVYSETIEILESLK